MFEMLKYETKSRKEVPNVVTYFGNCFHPSHEPSSSRPPTFLMGRPRLYHTPEEKLQARRVQSKKYYERHVPLIFFFPDLSLTVIGSTLSNRVQICRMRRKYKKSTKRETEVQDQQTTESDDVRYDEISRFRMIDLKSDSSLTDPIKTLAQARIAFEEKTQGDLYKYVDDVVKECIARPSSALEFCKETASVWVVLVEYIQACLGEVLQEYGCGREYDEANRVGADFRHVMFLLEEIEEFLMTREGELADWHASGCLGYQICWEGEKIERVST